MSDLPPLQGVAMDGRHLSQLKNLEREAPDQAAAEAAKQFEALFIQQMMKTMREAGGSSEFFDSNAMRTYTEMLDQQFSSDLAQRGIGLAEQLLGELQYGAK
ncbi:Peptidoglycan hydrolase FlgJ [Pseudidiomarina piscicola]|uniref:Peptidoglycan hydrolase FlgJ n=1 Tax=Pseudidiomarina piscicola TaxID=2614830 RepID=A0A6S6WLW1_9GAMM|nr:rod-binding protein [Pseudidiomarina piscicola]CAB0151039.1 Peptidoglycan hydrolase FlgJ [Pseudidiomarina piscicola]VZT40550.1 Peptidoglycan hydrolase FlgJ [Pseudomonas aeruginosa]